MVHPQTFKFTYLVTPLLSNWPVLLSSEQIRLTETLSGVTGHFYLDYRIRQQLAAMKTLDTTSTSLTF